MTDTLPMARPAMRSENRSGAADSSPLPALANIRRILFVTDAWHPQVNGVVRTLERLSENLPLLGVDVTFLTPQQFRSLPMPTYPEIRLALTTPVVVARRIEAAKADHVHIVTEGPLGIMARRYCLRRGQPFTSSYHTRFPEYVRARLPFPESWSYAWLRRFHNAAAATMVATESLRAELKGRGFTGLKPWTRGVDTELFDPSKRDDLLGLPRPIFLNVGRVAVEKNIGAFLDLDLPGSKVVVGDGPVFSALKAKYPKVHFLGEKKGADLACIYASSDVFVFPSRTDTFGIVLLEALASGLPVAAYPVTGPIDVVADGVNGALSESLGEAAMRALSLDRSAARQAAMRYSWRTCAEMILQEIEAVHANRTRLPRQQ